MDRSNLANRMKEYEKASQRYLTRRTPVILRLDGCHFHTFTRNFKRPFDDIFIETMQQTTKYLCENIQGAILGYTQSDEITILLVDYKKLNSSAWFDNRQNKIESVAASMCTMAFNKFFKNNVENFIQDCATDYETQGLCGKDTEEYKLCQVYRKAIEKGACFDCRAFNIPREEVTNNFYWRQLDCSRNSIQMVGQANFSHKELHKKNCNVIQDMLIEQKGINWNDFPTYQKRGTCVIKEDYFEPSEDGKDVKYPESCSNLYKDAEIKYGTWRTRWIIDKEIPIFKGEGREYIDKLVMVGN